MSLDKVVFRRYVPYVDRKSSLSFYCSDKTLGSSAIRCDPCFALIIVLPVTCLSIVRRDTQTLALSHMNPVHSPWCAACWQYPATFDKLVSLVKYFLSSSSGTRQVSSLTVLSSLGSQITPPAGLRPISSHKPCFFGIQIYWCLALKSNVLALSVRSGLNNLLGVSNLLNVGRLTVSGISVSLAICKEDQRNTCPFSWK